MFQVIQKDSFETSEPYLTTPMGSPFPIDSGIELQLLTRLEPVFQVVFDFLAIIQYLNVAWFYYRLRDEFYIVSNCQ